LTALSYQAERLRMVEQQLVTRGIRDPRVLAAMVAVPRHEFVPCEHECRAHEDHPLPIGYGQTISQPYMVGLMSEVLQIDGGEQVLEVGTGSGYQAAVLAEMGADVYGIERLQELAREAKQRLRRMGYASRVRVRVGDGAKGWLDAAPFDRIIVTAAVRRIPRELLAQLRRTGCLVLPLGESELQGLVKISRGVTGWEEEYFGECRFVKLVGADGWEEA
jgi:protein-L-isoaspartate(D-aspartate) O-methyltransferase